MSESIITIDKQTARRFVLGKQGLWPGRRRRGIAGTETAMREMQHLQLDPLNIVARSQDLKLHSRVIDYTPALWEELAYAQRKFFEWGGWLAVRPMDELPHWRVLMRRESNLPAWRKHARQHAAAIEEMRLLLRDRKTVCNRDFDQKDRKRIDSYRGRKDSAVALYHLWRAGEVMVHHRNRFERVYSLTQHVAPGEFIRESSDADADRYLLRKVIAFHGIGTFVSLTNALKRKVTAAEAKRLERRLIEENEITPVRVEGAKQIAYALAGDLPLLEQIAAGKIPRQWKPLETTTEEEVLFLAPLDIVSARGRAKKLFDFDYVWEVYKPLHQRKWGYYTLPILWGDRLVARADMKLDRVKNALVICGFWMEDPSTGTDASFGEALARGVMRLKKFVGADKLDSKCIRPAVLRQLLQQRDKLS